MKGFSVVSVVKRRWTVIVTVLVVTVAGFGVDRLHDVFGSNDVVSWPRADSIENSKFNPKQVLFEVFGSPGGAVATINYLDEHAQPQRVDDARLPWSQLLTTTDPHPIRRPACARGCRHSHLPHHRQRHRQGRKVHHQRERLHLLPGQVRMSEHRVDDPVRHSRVARTIRRLAIPIAIFWVAVAALTNVLLPHIGDRRRETHGGTKLAGLTVPEGDEAHRQGVRRVRLRQQRDDRLGR